MNRRARVAALVVGVLLLLAGQTLPLLAHVGSPDVFVETQAGPYTLFVTIRPPKVIPGVAEVEIQTGGAPEVREIRIVPTPLTGAAAAFSPRPDVAVKSPDDARTFTGHLWMMTAGAWQVRLMVDGASGTGTTSVPVPTLPQATTEMQRGLGVLLFALMSMLALGLVSVVSAMAREASLGAGEVADPARRRRGRVAAMIATLGVLAVLAFGNWWWGLEAAAYARYVYKPLQAIATIADGRLSLAVRDPGWIALRRTDDFVADHGHVMHLFVVSPALDRFWHLHPRTSGPATFEVGLPSMPGGPGGSYEFFADVVHASGIPETVTGRLDLPDAREGILTGDDSAWAGGPAGTRAAANTTSAPLPDGGRMVWLSNGPLKAGQLTLFTFRVEDAAGRPASDLELYMGMPGHAVFVSWDRQVFAHVHPSGSAPMATLEMSRRAIAGTESGAMTPDDMSHSSSLPATVSFPFGLPAAGDYRIFVQVKRSGRVDTGVFDLHLD